MKCPCIENKYGVSTDSSDGFCRCAYCSRILWFYRTAEYNNLNRWLEWRVIGLKSLFFGLWIFMEIRYLGVRGNGEKKMSPKDKKIKKRLDEITKELLDKYCGRKFFNLLAEDN